MLQEQMISELLKNAAINPKFLETYRNCPRPGSGLSKLWKFYDQFESSDRNLTQYRLLCASHLQLLLSLKFPLRNCDFFSFRILIRVFVGICLCWIISLAVLTFFPPERFSKLWEAKSYPSEKLSPKSHFLLRHFLTFSIIARIIYALMCQTCYIRYHKIYSAKFKQKRKKALYLVDYILGPKKRY